MWAWIHELKNPLIGTAGFLAVAMNLALWRMNRRLKKHFPSVYVELGQPRFFKPDTKPPGRAQSYENFVLFRRYRHLGDPKVALYGNVAFVCLWTALIIALFFIVFVAVPELRI